MTEPTPAHSSRRAYLGAVASAGIALAAGCLGSDGDDRYENVVLDEPEQYAMLREARDEGDVGYPIYGDELPQFDAPCTLRDRDVTPAEFDGDRHTMYTFVFTRCHGACPGLVSGLRHVQADSVDGGYADDVGFLTVTFDPEYDTPDVLEEYGHDLGVEYDLDNWYFLRPETEEDAQHLVEEQFGCYFARNPEYEEDRNHGHGHDEDDHEHGDDDHDEDDENGMEMAFEHESMIVLANADGYVERTYVGQVPTPDTLIDDARTLVERW